MLPPRHLALMAVVGMVGGGFFVVTQAAQTFEVIAKDFRFTPQNVHIKVGDTVRWVNREKRANHSILFTGEGAVESERLFPDEVWERVFSEPGVYNYICGPHPEMAGAITVTE